MPWSRNWRKYSAFQPSQGILASANLEYWQVFGSVVQNQRLANTQGLQNLYYDQSEFRHQNNYYTFGSVHDSNHNGVVRTFVGYIPK